MKICDNCKKESEVLWYHEIKIPNISIKTNKLAQDFAIDEINKTISENRISKIPMMICSDCREFYGAS